MSNCIRNADECVRALEMAMEAIEPPLEVFEGILRVIADFAKPYRESSCAQWGARPQVLAYGAVRKSPLCRVRR